MDHFDCPTGHKAKGQTAEHDEEKALKQVPISDIDVLQVDSYFVLEYKALNARPQTSASSVLQRRLRRKSYWKKKREYYQ